VTTGDLSRARQEEPEEKKKASKSDERQEWRGVE
jgi:hypothetical protein